jgi:predicted Zn finger-like uncharacterized protein
VRIRCERCATIYELDEKRLAPHGALVECTRCGHVFRAAPTPGASPPPQDPSGEGMPAGDERTALFGFSASGMAEQTANIASVKPPEPAQPRRREAQPPAPSARPGRPASPEPEPTGTRWAWWVLAAILAALVLAAGWYAVQSRVATPTTRLPAVAELLPT